MARLATVGYIDCVTSSIKRSHSGSEVWKPLRGLFRFTAIVGLSLLAGIVIPGLVAFQSHVFFRQPMEDIVRAKYGEVGSKLDAYNKHTQELKSELDAVNRNASANPTGVSVNAVGRCGDTIPISGAKGFMVNRYHVATSSLKGTYSENRMSSFCGYEVSSKDHR